MYALFLFLILLCLHDSLFISAAVSATDLPDMLMMMPLVEFVQFSYVNEYTRKFECFYNRNKQSNYGNDAIDSSPSQ